MGEFGVGSGRVRGRDGRALRACRACGAGRVRRRGHRLGAGTGVRAAVTTTPSVGPQKIISPVTEQVIATVDFADEAAVDHAVARARKAFDSWRTVSPGDRARLLRRFAQ